MRCLLGESDEDMSAAPHGRGAFAVAGFGGAGVPWVRVAPEMAFS
jgi:hypothetical protein